jgi:hypothetical protein
MWQKPRVLQSRSAHPVFQSRHFMKTTTRLGLILSSLSVICISSCAPGGKSPSGFFSNYAQLNAGYGTADAVSSYVKPGVDLKKYDSVIIDPVSTVVADPEVSPAVSAQLASYLAGSLSDSAVTSLRVVSVPGPTTMRIRTNLTDVIEGKESGRPVKTIHTAPVATLTGNLGSAALANFISNVSFEGEVVDSLTGERLLALMDHRLGHKREATPATSWAGVRSAVNQGVLKLRGRFTALQNR